MLCKEFFCSAAVVSALFPLTLSAAAPYQAEMGAEYTDVSSNDFMDDGRSLQLHGTYYLDPVEAGEYPLSEAAFVSRASGVSAHLIEQRTDFPSRFGSSGSSDTQGLGLSGWYVHKELGWLVSGGISREEVDYPAQETEVDGYSLSVGKYLWDTTTLVIGYVYREEDTDYRTFPCTGLGGCPDLIDPPDRETENISVSFRHLGRYEDYHYTVDVSYALENEEHYHWENDSDQYSLMFSAYPNRNTRILLGYERVDARDRAQVDGTDTYRIGVEYFVTPAFAVFVSYEELKVDTDQMIPVFEAVTAFSEDPLFGISPDEPFGVIVPPYRLEPASLDTESLSVGVRVRF